MNIWQIEPDWTNGVTETLEWKTDVLRSHSGAEQRIALRLTPRRVFEFSILVADKERQQLENWLYFYGGSDLLMPVFSDIYQVGSTIAAGEITIPMISAGRDIHAGSQILIKSGLGFSNALYVVRVDTVNDDSVTLSTPLTAPVEMGAFIYPLRKAILTDPPEFEKHSDNVSSAQIRFRISEHNQYSHDISFLPVYRGFPVFNISPDWSETIKAKYERLMLELDNQTGIPARTDTARRPFFASTLQYEACGRDIHSQLRRVLYYLRGQQKPLWLSSYSNDLTAVSDITNNTLDIQSVGYFVANGRNDIVITLTNGEQHYKRITGAAVINKYVERLALEGDLLTVPRDQIMSISFLTLCRLSNDSVQYEHITDADGVATITLNFLGVRDELE